MDLVLQDAGQNASGVEVALFIPNSPGDPGCDTWPARLTKGHGEARTGVDGRYAWRRVIGPRLDRGKYSLMVCARVDGDWRQLWRDYENSPRRHLRLACDLSLGTCQSEYVPQLDEELFPANAGLWLWTMFCAAFSRNAKWIENHRAVGWLSLAYFVAGPVCWCLHGYPQISEPASVLLLCFGIIVQGMFWGAFVRSRFGRAGRRQP